jgi:predicted amino acid dehydrogenase
LLSNQSVRGPRPGRPGCWPNPHVIGPTTHASFSAALHHHVAVVDSDHPSIAPLRPLPDLFIEAEKARDARPPAQTQRHHQITKRQATGRSIDRAVVLLLLPACPLLNRPDLVACRCVGGVTSATNQHRNVGSAAGLTHIVRSASALAASVPVRW